MLHPDQFDVTVIVVMMHDNIVVCNAALKMAFRQQIVCLVVSSRPAEPFRSDACDFVSNTFSDFANGMDNHYQ